MGMRNCPNCGNGVDEAAIKCPHCGAETNFQVAKQAVRNPKETSVKTPKKNNPQPIILVVILIGIFLIANSMKKPDVQQQGINQSSKLTNSAAMQQCLNNKPPKSEDQNYTSQLTYYNSCKAAFQESEKILTSYDREHLFDKRIPSGVSDKYLFAYAQYSLNQLYYRGSATAVLASEQGNRETALELLNDIESIYTPYKSVAPASVYKLLDVLKKQYGNPYLDSKKSRQEVKCNGKKAGRPILINNFEWTNISFPEFEELM